MNNMTHPQDPAIDTAGMAKSDASIGIKIGRVRIFDRQFGKADLHLNIAGVEKTMEVSFELSFGGGSPFIESVSLQDDGSLDEAQRTEQALQILGDHFSPIRAALKEISDDFRNR